MAGPVAVRRKAQIYEARRSKKKREGKGIPSLQTIRHLVLVVIAVRLKEAFSRTAAVLTNSRRSPNRWSGVFYPPIHSLVRFTAAIASNP
jgi:hypothetical protein